MIDFYGLELALDIHDCRNLPASREILTTFFRELCVMLDMKREDLHFWDYDGLPEEYAKAPPHLKGISAVQFIKTSNITIHTLDDLRRVYINIFSCKEFDAKEAEQFCSDFFLGRIENRQLTERV